MRLVFFLLDVSEMNAGGFGLILYAEVLQPMQSERVTVCGHCAHSREGGFPPAKLMYHRVGY